jgi:hypothetical protein
MSLSEQLREVYFTQDNGESWTKGKTKGAAMNNGEMVGWKIAVEHSQSDLIQGQEIEIPITTHLIRKNELKGNH